MPCWTHRFVMKIKYQNAQERAFEIVVHLHTGRVASIFADMTCSKPCEMWKLRAGVRCTLCVVVLPWLQLGGLNNQQTTGNQAMNTGHIRYVDVDFYFAKDL